MAKKQLKYDDVTEDYGDNLKTPEDVRRKISQWIAFACANGRLPFDKDGGTIIQGLNTILKSYEQTEIAEIKARIKALESGQRAAPEGGKQ